jgi:hypothetical protein
VLETEAPSMKKLTLPLLGLEKVISQCKMMPSPVAVIKLRRKLDVKTHRSNIQCHPETGILVAVKPVQHKISRMCDLVDFIKVMAKFPDQETFSYPPGLQ